MTSDADYRKWQGKALEWLSDSTTYAEGTDAKRTALAYAQVYATLANAAATAGVAVVLDR